MIGAEREEEGLYFFDPYIGSHLVACSTSTQDTWLWHCRLGHPSSNVLRHLVPSLNLNNNYVSEGCQYGKQRRPCFKSFSNNKSSTFLSLIHYDVWISHVVSPAGFRCFITFIDDYSCMTWVYI